MLGCQLRGCTNSPSRRPSQNERAVWVRAPLSRVLKPRALCSFRIQSSAVDGMACICLLSWSARSLTWQIIGLQIMPPKYLPQRLLKGTSVVGGTRWWTRTCVSYHSIPVGLHEGPYCLLIWELWRTLWILFPRQTLSGSNALAQQILRLLGAANCERVKMSVVVPC